MQFAALAHVFLSRDKEDWGKFRLSQSGSSKGEGAEMWNKAKRQQGRDECI